MGKTDEFDQSFRPIVICTIICGFTVISMIDFMGNALGELNKSAVISAEKGLVMVFIMLTSYIILLTLVYAFHKLLGPKIRLFINSASTVTFIIAFFIAGHQFSKVFNDLFGFSQIRITGEAEKALLAVISVPLATTILICILLFARGRKWAGTKIAARRSAPRQRSDEAFSPAQYKTE